MPPSPLKFHVAVAVELALDDHGTPAGEAFLHQLPASLRDHRLLPRLKGILHGQARLCGKEPQAGGEVQVAHGGEGVPGQTQAEEADAHQPRQDFQDLPHLAHGTLTFSRDRQITSQGATYTH